MPVHPAGYAASTRGRPLTAKRKRSHQIALRLNDQELRHLNRQSSLSGLPREAYIRSHYQEIKEYANVVEHRVDDSGCTLDMLLRDNAQTLESCREHGLPYILIDRDYDIDL